MRPAPPRFAVVRRPTRRQLLTVVAALVALVAVHQVTSSAAATKARLGTMTDLWVARDELPAGSSIEPGDVDLESLPAGLVPGTPVDDPVGRVVRTEVLAGEVLVEERLGEGHQSGPAGLVPAGWRGVAVPTAGAALPVEVGNRVDVVAAFDPGLAAPEPATVVVADALVVHVDQERGSVTVAVPRPRVPAVAFALVTGVVSLALVG